MKRAALIIALALTAPLAAEEVKATPPPLTTQPAGNSWQIAAYLGGMLALFGGGLWLLRNGLPALQRGGKGQRKLQISETRGLGARQFLVVAEYENRKMLLGVCPGRIDYLCTLAGAEPEFPPLGVEKPE